jgi:aminoglycoside 6'-N-acetyltransferase
VGVRVRGTLTALRSATAGDAELLSEWHRDPEIARFWDGETYTPAQIRERLARADVDAYIVEANGAPVGFVQAWRGPDRTGGLDMFLVPDARGRNYGPDAARALATYLRAHGWTSVTVDPYLWNEQAIRAWERAGFVPVGEREPDAEHTAPWLLMEFAR